MKRLALSALLVLAMAAWMPACRNVETANGTAAFVTVVYGAIPSVQQLRFSLITGSGNLFPPQLRPQTASSALLASPQSVRILLPDATAGPATIHAEGLSSGTTVALGDAATSLRPGSEVSVSITLHAGTGCSCPGKLGCCLGNTCVTTPDVNNCGQGGALCAACDARSDRCAADGHCVCGDTGAPCAQGLACNNGECTCDPNSCSSGCCSNRTTCNLEHTQAACGVAGSSCDNCGLGPCDNGGVCTQSCGPSGSNACGSGCCSGNTCITSRTVFSCGTGGDTCVVCDQVRANNCAFGTCRCGSLSGPCGAHERCVTSASGTLAATCQGL